MTKHVAVAYALWLVGFWMGLHHLYLHRARAAFLHTVSLNMCGLGWWRDLLLLPRFVAEANGEYRALVAADSAHNTKPRVAWLVVLLQVVLALFFGSIASSLLPSGWSAISYEALFATGAAWAIWFGGTALDLALDASLVRVGVAVYGVVLPACVITGGDISDQARQNARVAAVLLGCLAFWSTRTWSAVYLDACVEKPLALVSSDGGDDNDDDGDDGDGGADDSGESSSSSSSRNALAPPPSKPPTWRQTLAAYYALVSAFAVALSAAVLFHGEVTVTANGEAHTLAVADVVANVMASDARWQHVADFVRDVLRTAAAATDDAHAYERFVRAWRTFEASVDDLGCTRVAPVPVPAAFALAPGATAPSEPTATQLRLDRDEL